MPRTWTLGEVVLARSCQHCGGDGKVEVYTGKGEPKDEAEYEAHLSLVKCGECEGRGGHVTDEGEEILSFVKKFGRE